MVRSAWRWTHGLLVRGMEKTSCHTGTIDAAWIAVKDLIPNSLCSKSKDLLPMWSAGSGDMWICIPISSKNNFNAEAPALKRKKKPVNLLQWNESKTNMKSEFCQILAWEFGTIRLAEMSVSLWRKCDLFEKRCFYEHGSRSAGMYICWYIYIYICLYKHHIIQFSLSLSSIYHHYCHYFIWLIIVMTVLFGILLYVIRNHGESDDHGIDDRPAARSATVTPGSSVQWSNTLAAWQSRMSAKRCFGPGAASELAMDMMYWEMINIRDGSVYMYIYIYILLYYIILYYIILYYIILLYVTILYHARYSSISLHARILIQSTLVKRWLQHTPASHD